MDFRDSLLIRAGIILVMVVLLSRPGVACVQAETCAFATCAPSLLASDPSLGVYDRSVPSPAVPIPATEDLLATAETIRTREWKDLDTPPSVLRSTMLDLIDGGNPELAWAFLMRAWPEEHPGRGTFLGELLEELAESPTWLQIGG
jgi:hypothetical protein